MSIVKHTDKETGRTYVYESTPHYDPATKQQRPKRKYLGMLDPVTGELIPSAGKRGRKPGAKNILPPGPKKSASIDIPESELRSQLKQLKSEVQALSQKNLELCKEIDNLRQRLDSTRSLVQNI